MRTPRAVNSQIDDLFERKYRKVGQEKNALGFFSRRVFCFKIVTPGKGSKYPEFYDLSGRITCMGKATRPCTILKKRHRRASARLCLRVLRPRSLTMAVTLDR